MLTDYAKQAILAGNLPESYTEGDRLMCAYDCIEVERLPGKGLRVRIVHHGRAIYENDFPYVADGDTLHMDGLTGSFEVNLET